MNIKSSWGQLTGVIKKVFFHLFFLSILNAYILYKQRTQSPVLQRTFQRELVKELVRNSGIFPSLTPRGCTAKGLTCLQAGGQRKYWALGSLTSPGHVWFAFLPKRRSWQGQETNRRGQEESSFQCSVCKVALCMQDCFKLYHTI